MCKIEKNRIVHECPKTTKQQNVAASVSLSLGIDGTVK
jgi:hypothetical protein